MPCSTSRANLSVFNSLRVILDTKTSGCEWNFHLNTAAAIAGLPCRDATVVPSFKNDNVLYWLPFRAKGRGSCSTGTGRHMSFLRCAAAPPKAEHRRRRRPEFRHAGHRRQVPRRSPRSPIGRRLRFVRQFLRADRQSGALRHFPLRRCRIPAQTGCRGIWSGTPVFTYAVGRLVVWVPVASLLDPATALRDPSLKHLAIANPQHAPYGRAAQAALQSMGLYQGLQPKLVLGENISQTLQFVESGAADAGIVALSLALAPPVRARGRYWEIPADQYPRMEQGGIILKDSMAAHDFRDFLLSGGRTPHSETIRFLRTGGVIWTGRQSGSAYGSPFRPRRFCWFSVCLSPTGSRFLRDAGSFWPRRWWRCRWCCRPPFWDFTCCWPSVRAARWARSIPSSRVACFRSRSRDFCSPACSTAFRLPSNRWPPPSPAWTANSWRLPGVWACRAPLLSGA